MQPRKYQSLIGKCSQEATGCQLNFLSTYSVVSLVVPKLEEEILTPLQCTVDEIFQKISSSKLGTTRLTTL